VNSELLARWSRLAGDDGVAVHEPQGAVSYREAIARSRGCASALLAGRASLQGQRVALLVSPGASFVQAFFGVLQAGGCAVVLSTLHPRAETAWMCEDAEVETIVASGSLLDRVQGMAARVLAVEQAVDASLAELPEVQAQQAALQLYTSGTTGKPKGAVLTHANLSIQQELLAEAWEFERSDVLLHALPLHHMHGLCIALLTSLGAGAATRMLPAFEATAVWEAMAESTVLMAVPTMYAKLFAAFDQADEATRTRWAQQARRLRLATSGSAALPVTLGQRWSQVAGSYPVERFGMTELGVGASNPVRGERRPGSVGRPLRTVETRVVDDELWFAGPSVFAEYWRRPEATAAAFVEHEGKRWFRSGDTVALEADGYIRVLGRTSVDIIKSGGYKLSALELEEVLRGHPAVAEVAVVGVPDEVWGERVVACVVARSGQEEQCDTGTLRAYAGQHLAAYKLPREVVRVPELPRNAMGKVLKPVLRKKLGGAPGSSR
jgi:malonyl-CoA/methylmalonyl-CoA synthetase